MRNEAEAPNSWFLVLEYLVPFGVLIFYDMWDIPFLWIVINKCQPKIQVSIMSTEYVVTSVKKAQLPGGPNHRE